MTAAQRATLERLVAGFDGHTDAHVVGIADALRAALGTCGTCEYIHDATKTHGQCLPPTVLWHDTRFPFAYKSMPLGERCTGYTPKEGA